MEWGQLAFGVLYSSQRGNPIEMVDNGENTLFHLKGMSCVSVILK